MPQTMPSPPGTSSHAVCRAAAASFAVGLISLRVCWLPGVNVVLAAASVALGVFAVWQILHSHGTMRGMDEAVSGLVLGVVVIGLSTFFISALVAAWRH
jgi:hypothetical protein